MIRAKCCSGATFAAVSGAKGRLVSATEGLAGGAPAGVAGFTIGRAEAGFAGGSAVGAVVTGTGGTRTVEVGAGATAFVCASAAGVAAEGAVTAGAATTGAATTGAGTALGTTGAEGLTPDGAFGCTAGGAGAALAASARCVSGSKGNSLISVRDSGSVAFAGNPTNPPAKTARQAKAAIKLNRRRLMLYQRLGPLSLVESPKRARKKTIVEPFFQS
jgi:hypothetical protein